jgi:hypothetical protein
MARMDVDRARRRFIRYFSSIGLSSTLLPGVLWGKMQEQSASRITSDMLRDALAVAGMSSTEAQQQRLLAGANQSLQDYEALRKIPIEPTEALPLYFNPIVPGTRIDRVQRPFRPSPAPSLRRPADLEDAAFWPVAHLAGLIKTRQVAAVELAEMYLARLKRYNPVLNCVVTFTEERAMKEARQADREIAAGKYRGPLHGIPWGCKDLFAVPGYPTQWGSPAFRGQMFDYEATVVRLLREAGGRAAIDGSAGAPTIHGTPRKDRADRPPDPRVPRRRVWWLSASEPRRAGRS